MGVARWALVTADAASLLMTFAFASLIRFEVFRSEPLHLFHGAPVPELDYSLLGLIATPVWMALIWRHGLYEDGSQRSGELRRLLPALVTGTILFLVLDSLFELHIARGWAFSALIVGAVMVLVGRTVVRKAFALGALSLKGERGARSAVRRAG